MAQYPQAQAILKRRAHSVMRKNEARERNRAKKSASMNSVDVVIANPMSPKSPPKLLETVIKALPEESAAVKLLTQGSNRVRKRRDSTITNISFQSKELNNQKQIEIEIEDDKPKTPSSPDLLTAIDAALSHRSSFMNLTDTEKVLIASSNDDNTTNNQIDFKNDFLDPMDGRMECFELDNLSNWSRKCDANEKT